MKPTIKPPFTTFYTYFKTRGQIYGSLYNGDLAGAKELFTNSLILVPANTKIDFELSLLKK